LGKNCPGNDPETASLPIRVFHSVPEPSFSAAQNSLPGIDFRDVLRAEYFDGKWKCSISFWPIICGALGRLNERKDDVQ
jgi:hypothetical protein